MRHELKCWPKFFDAIVRGDKTFEVRKNDRNFTTGDHVRLREWDPEKAARIVSEGAPEPYTGRELELVITYVLKGEPALGLALDGMSVFSFKVLPEIEGVPV